MHLPFVASASDHLRAANAVDPSSLSNSCVARAQSLQLNVEVDFASKTVFGTATYEVLTSDKHDDGDLKYVSFDCKDLVITSATVNECKCDFVLVPVDGFDPKIFGLSLRVMLPFSPPPSSTLRVSIAYSTTPNSSAIQWLPPSQTLGKKMPYMFTQCQAIHARTLLPCQDSPAAKITYKANVTAPEWATVLMSALARGQKHKPSNDSEEKDKSAAAGSGNGKTVWTWEQPKPISTYLIAMVVGDLASSDISPRCRVWSEPGLLDAVAYEFAETEQFLLEAEKLTLPYAWGRYDVVCLPPSFPYGGMENPCLTFVTPTLLAGDRSLADVVAHEIAHSWTGNLVTNATWEHFWLNEGYTMWLQRKIMARVKKDNKFFDFDAIAGWEHLREDIKTLPDDFTRSVPIIKGCDPDEAFSGVPYEKGFNLLYALERRVGSPAFEEFTKSYMKRFQFVTVTSSEFRSFFESYFNGNASVKDFPWDEWFHKPGMPSEEPPFDRTLSQASESLAALWIDFDAAANPSVAATPSVDISKWTTNQKTCFLDTVLAKVDSRKAPLKCATVRAMDAQYAMSATKNSEVLFRFSKLAIGAEDKSILPVALRFVTTVGRMKFVRPLYRALFASEMGRALAVSTFIENRTFYHAIAAKMVASDMGIADNDASKGGGAAVGVDKKDGGGGSSSSTKNKNMLVMAGIVCVAAIVAVTVFGQRRK